MTKPEVDKMSHIIKERLYETALNNIDSAPNFAEACEEIADNRIDTWIDDAFEEVDNSEVVNALQNNNTYKLSRIKNIIKAYDEGCSSEFATINSIRRVVSE